MLRGMVDEEEIIPGMRSSGKDRQRKVTETVVRNTGIPTAGSAKLNRIEQRYRQRRESGSPGWTDDYTGTEDELRDFLTRNGLTAAGNFLELGCGAGNRTIIAARMGFHAFGIDISKEAVAWANAKNAAEKTLAEFQIGDITSLAAFQADFFDVVYDGGVLYMITNQDDRRNCFANIARILKPGGFLYATAHLANIGFHERFEMAPDSWYDPEGRFTTISGEPAYYFSTEDEFCSEIGKAGLIFVRIKSYAEVHADRPFHAGEVLADARRPI